MKAFLLAAGLGTRLKPVTDTVPKCMVPIDGRPLLDIWLDSFAHTGVDEVLVNLHHLPDVVGRHIATRTVGDIGLKIREPVFNTRGFQLRGRGSRRVSCWRLREDSQRRQI